MVDTGCCCYCCSEYSDGRRCIIPKRGKETGVELEWKGGRDRRAVETHGVSIGGVGSGINIATSDGTKF